MQKEMALRGTEPFKGADGEQDNSGQNLTD